MKILLLVPNLDDYCSSAHQARQLGPRLETLGHEVHLVAFSSARCLGRSRTEKIHIHSLGGSYPLDPVPLWRLRRLLTHLQPEGIHAWGLSNLRRLGLVGRGFLPRVRLHSMTSDLPLRFNLGRLDRWLLQRVAAIVAQSHFEAETLRNWCVCPDRIQLIPPGVDLPPESASKTNNNPWANSPFLAFLGSLDKSSGAREAIWAMDILSHVHPDLSLQIMGTGPDQGSLQSFAAKMYHPQRSRFLGQVANPAAVFSQSALCLLSTTAWSGVQTALAAQAAGCPVVAFAHPHLRDIIQDGSTGLFVPPGDVVALARQTHGLLQNASRLHAMRAAARLHVARNFPADRMVQECLALHSPWAAAA